MRTIKMWHYVLNADDCRPEQGGTIIPMASYTHFRDFYLCIPATGIYARSANFARYGQYKYEYFIDGEFVGAGLMYKAHHAKELYDAGYINEAKDYILGYMLWRETTLGGNHINKYKEAARISHDLCDLDGKSGHEARQMIRRKLLWKTY